MIAMIDVLDDVPYDITEIFNSVLESCGFQEKLLCKVDGLTPNIVIPSNVKGVIISGSVHHIYDSEGNNWKETLSEFVRKYYKQVPILGICFGHQVIAQALAGKVVQNDLGKEIGTVPIYTTPEAGQDLLFNGFRSGRLVPESHLDHVVELPPEAVRLAYNDHSPNQAFRVGKSWGIQFHPELQPQLFKQLLLGRVKKMFEEGNVEEASRLQEICESVRECPESVEVLRRFVSFCLAEL